MRFLFPWSWFILVLALLVPLDLPAGGSSKNKSDYIQINKSDLYFASDKCYLRSSPSSKGSFLRQIPIGTPLRIGRCWET